MQKFNPTKMTPLKDWIRRNRFMTNSKDYTHLLLDGGKINIPKESQSKFLKIYAKDTENNEDNFICEIKTEKFKFFSDLDFFEADEAISENEILEYISTIQTVIYEFYNKTIDPEDLYVCICTAPSKEKYKNGQKYIKTGIHLIWPNVYTTKQTALLLRHGMIKALELGHGERDSYNKWEEVVDLCVYNANGLRMLGSKKIGICNICKNSKEKICENNSCFLVNNKRRIYEDRPYKLKWVMGCDEEQTNCVLNPNKEEYYNKDIYQCIRDTSIRLTEHIPESVYYTPIWVQYKDKPKRRLISRKLPSKEDIEGIKSFETKQRIELTNKKAEMIKRFLKNNLPVEYGKWNITNIFITQSGTYLITTDSNYCMNIRKEHNSNSVWFYIDNRGVSQRCFCRCDKLEDRQFGYCKDFKSEPMEISTKLKNELFPKKEPENLEYKFKVSKTLDDRINKLMTKLEEDINFK